MALPFSFSSELQWSAFKNGRCGPFESGGNLYAVLFDATANTIEVWKSTDGGNSWAEQDSANHEAATDAGAAYESFDVVQVGSTLYITYLYTNEIWRVTAFSCSTDLWGSSTTNGAGAFNLSASEDAHVTGTAALQLARRSGGDSILLRQGDAVANMGTSYRRVAYMISGSSTENDVAELSGSSVHADLRAIAIDAADRTYFFYTKSSGGLFCKTLTSANTLNAETTVDSTVSHTVNYSAGHAAWIDDATDKIVIAYVDSTGDLVLAYADVADSPSWSTTAITTTNDPETANSNPASVALDGTTVYVFWPNDADQDIYRNSGTTGSGFGSDVEWKDAVTCNGISIGKLTDGIGVLYFDGTTVKYDIYSSATGATGTITAGSLTVGGQSITATYPITGTVNTGSLTVAGQTVTADPAVLAAVSSGSHAVSGQSITATTGTTATIATGSHAVSGQAVAGTYDMAGTIAAGELAVSGQTVTGSVGDTGTISTGAHAVTGQTVSGTTGVLGTIATGSHAVTGQTVNADPAVTGTVATGSHAVSGQAIAATTGTTATISTGSLAVTGQTVTADPAVLAAVASGSLAITGQTVLGDDGGGAVNATGTVSTGSHAVTGQTITADPAVLASLSSGSLAVTGQTITADPAVLASVSTGSHAVSGQTVTGTTGTLATVNTGSLAVTGQTITADPEVLASVATGNLTVEGQSVGGGAPVTATIQTGELSVMGQLLNAIINYGNWSEPMTDGILTWGMKLRRNDGHRPMRLR